MRADGLNDSDLRPYCDPCLLAVYWYAHIHDISQRQSRTVDQPVSWLYSCPYQL
jgi:hypothetical protein